MRLANPQLAIQLILPIGKSTELSAGAVHAVWSEVYMNGATEFINNGGGPHGGEEGKDVKCRGEGNPS